VWFDLLVIAAALAGLVAGAWKGLAWQLAGIGSFVLGFFVGLPLSTFIAGGMHEPTTFTRFLIFAICYAGISLGCYGVALLLRKKLEAFKLERFDKHTGAFLGAFHGLLLAAVFTLFLVALFPSTARDVLTSPSGKAIGHTLDAMHGILPDGIHEILHPYMHPPEEPVPHPPEPHPHEPR